MAYKVPYLILADAVHKMQNGKLNIVGIFDRLFFRNLPGALAECVIVALIAATGDDDLGQHAASFRIESPGRETLAEIGGDMRFEATGVTYLGQIRAVIQMRNLVFREYGRHRVTLYIDDEEVAFCPISVEEPPEGFQD